MKKTTLLSATMLAPLAFLALAACGGEAPPPPAADEVAAPLPAEPTPTMPAPDETIFAEAFAEACPDAEPVATSLCRSMGMGQSDFACRYGLGEDNNLRHNATLTPEDGEWTIVDPETVCAQRAR